MSIRAQVSAWIIGFGLVAPSLAIAQDRTERDVVELIVREGPQVGAIRAAVEVSRREQLARLAYPNPSVLYSRESAGFTEFLQVEQSVPLFGVRRALSRVGIEATAAAEAERDARLWTLRAEASYAVARLVAQQDRLQAAETYIREFERLIGILRTREREGEGSRFDRLRAEQELRDARQIMTTIAVGAADAKAAVLMMLPRETLLGRVIGTQIREPQSPELPTLLTRAQSSRAELRALERADRRAEFEGDAARRARLPSPTVFGGLKRADDSFGRARGSVFGLNLTLPVFDTGGREAARWAAERGRIEAERAAVEEAIRSDVTRARETLALRHAALAQDQEGEGDELLRIAEVAYREGEVGILELLDAVRTAWRARTRSIDIRLDARLAQIALERAVGDVLWP